MRRRLGEGLGRKPSREESSSMLRCARLRCIADHAADPASGAGATDIVRLQNAAARAEAAMERLLERNAPPEYRPSLDEILTGAE